MNGSKGNSSARNHGLHCHFMGFPVNSSSSMKPGNQEWNIMKHKDLSNNIIWSKFLNLKQKQAYNVGPPRLARLVQKTPITMVYGTYNSYGGFINQLLTRVHHIVGVSSFVWNKWWETTWQEKMWSRTSTGHDLRLGCITRLGEPDKEMFISATRKNAYCSFIVCRIIYI